MTVPILQHRERLDTILTVPITQVTQTVGIINLTESLLHMIPSDTPLTQIVVCFGTVGDGATLVLQVVVGIETALASGEVDLQTAFNDAVVVEPQEGLVTASADAVGVGTAGFLLQAGVVAQ